MTPVLFIGHGSPMLAITENPWREAWHQLGERLPRPAAILCVSAHWQTEQPSLCVADPPQTIHDFGGFPPALHAQQYPAPGAPHLLAPVQALAPEVEARADWGLDHGAWCVLQALFPGADVPVAQLSLGRLSAAQHLDLARRLAPLREQGVLLLASGNGVHNLRLARPGPPADWALAFDAFLGEAIAQRDDSALLDPFRFGEPAQRAIPTPEHYLPLLYAHGFSRVTDPVRQFNTDIDLGSIGMRSAVWGLEGE